MDTSYYFDIVELCKKYYPEKKFNHAKRVETYAVNDTRYALLSLGEKYLVRAIALAHDLLEDTKCTREELISVSGNNCSFVEGVERLTHTKDKTYYDYVKAIVDSRDVYAIIVKTADMKDHLTLKKTLTEKLKAKYAPVIPLLLGRG